MEGEGVTARRRKKMQRKQVLSSPKNTAKQAVLLAENALAEAY